MRIRPTELGLKGLLLLAALELAFLATSYSNLFFLLITFCCVLGGLGALGALANLRGTTVCLAAIPLASAGTARSLTARITAGGRRRFDLALSLEGDGDRLELGHVPLADGAAEHTLSLPPRPRGVFAARWLRVSSRHPFGLFQASRRFRIEAEVVTHPAPAEAPSGSRGGGAGARRGDFVRSSTVAGLRAFRGGDPLAAVHWKATARRGVPIVKEHEAEGGDRVDVALDRRCTADALEHALSVIAGLVLSARDGGAPLHLRSQDFVIEVGKDRSTAAAALRWLAAATPLPSTAAEVTVDRAESLRLPANRTEPAHA